MREGIRTCGAERFGEGLLRKRQSLKEVVGFRDGVKKVGVLVME